MKDLKLRIQTVKPSRKGRGGVQSIFIVLVVFALGFYIGRTTGGDGIKEVFSTLKISSDSGSQFGIETGDGVTEKYLVDPAGGKTQSMRGMEPRSGKERAGRKTGAGKQALTSRVVAEGDVLSEAAGRTETAAPIFGNYPVSTSGSPAEMKSITFTIQVSAFKKADLAQKYTDELRERGYDAYVHPVLNSKGESWHLVKVGRFNSAEEAGDFAAIFQQSESTSAYVEEVGGPVFYDGTSAQKPEQPALW